MDRDRLQSGLAAMIERFRPRGATRQWIFGLAAAGFALGFIAAVGSVDLQLQQLKWPALLALFAVGVPSMTLANAAEYKVAGSLVARDVSWTPAIRMAVLSTAANLLPFPGGPLVRAKGLIDEGASRAGAVLATVLMAGAWLATSLVVAGLLGGLETGTSLAVSGAGLVVGVGVGLSLWKRAPRRRKARSLVAVGMVELAATCATGFRLWLVAQALGFDIGTGAFVLGIAPVLGAVVFLVPAGLGVRELVASLAAPAIGLDPAAGFLIAALDRLAGLLVHGTAAGVIALTSRGSSTASEAG